MKLFGRDYDPYMVLAGILGVAAIFLVLYILASESIFDSKGPLPGDFQNSAKAISFHPDSVVSFEWEVGDEYFAFHRKDRLSPWSPAVNPKDIQVRLNLFASLNYNLRDISEDQELIGITLKLDNQKLMKGFWTGYDLVWVRGPLKGRAAKLNQTQTRLFLAGINTFKTKKIKWCNKRPDRFDFIITNRKGKITSFTLENQSGLWVHSHGNMDINPTVLEKWIGRHCQIKADLMVDPGYLDYFEAPTTDEQMIVRFPGIGDVQFRWSPTGFVRMISPNLEQEQYFYSDAFVSGFQSLQPLHPQDLVKEN